jgi:hypothetical protein
VAVQRTLHDGRARNVDGEEMRKFISLAAASTTLAILLVAAAGATAQTTTSLAATSNTPEGFSFKGNPLGMTLEQFQLASPTTPCFTKGQIDAVGKYLGDDARARIKPSMAQANVDVLQSELYAVRGKQDKAAAQDAINAAILEVKKSQDDLAALEQHAPRNFPWAVGLGVQGPNTVACSSASSIPFDRSPKNDANPDGLMIGSATAAAVVYQFLDGRLYRVTILFPAHLLSAFKDSFTAKYGESTVESPDDYQNGFGANWRGANFAWTHGSQRILLHEGQGNGPAQDTFSTVMYIDHDLDPAPAKPVTNF